LFRSCVIVTVFSLSFPLAFSDSSSAPQAARKSVILRIINNIALFMLVSSFLIIKYISKFFQYIVDNEYHYQLYVYFTIYKIKIILLITYLVVFVNIVNLKTIYTLNVFQYSIKYTHTLFITFFNSCL